MKPTVAITISHGNLTLKLFPEEAPLTVSNFLGYVEDRFYDGTLIHRVIPQFMIQGGGYELGLKLKQTRTAIRNESSNGLTNQRGAVAIARTGDPHSATCQFFINLGDNDFLNRGSASDAAGQCVFGRVVDGMEVVDAIASVKTGDRAGHYDVPLQDVVIQKIRRVEPIDPAWRTQSVVAVAQTIEEERSFELLAILSDALEEAGCTNASVLEHCRSPGEHRLGCWVVDLLLEK